MEIKYLVTLNDKANYLARIRTSKKGRIALRYQKLLARISNVLASNLNKMLTVQSEYTHTHTHTPGQKWNIIRSTYWLFTSMKIEFGTSS